MVMTLFPSHIAYTRRIENPRIDVKINKWNYEYTYIPPATMKGNNCTIAFRTCAAVQLNQQRINMSAEIGGVNGLASVV